MMWWSWFGGSGAHFDGDIAPSRQAACRVAVPGDDVDLDTSLAESGITTTGELTKLYRALTMIQTLMQMTLELAFPCASWAYTGPMLRRKTIPLVTTNGSCQWTMAEKARAKRR